MSGPLLLEALEKAGRKRIQSNARFYSLQHFMVTEDPRKEISRWDAEIHMAHFLEQDPKELSFKAEAEEIAVELLGEFFLDLDGLIEDYIYDEIFGLRIAQNKSINSSCLYWQLFLLCSPIQINNTVLMEPRHIRCL